ncbi:AzlD domain-containing protein [Rhizobium sp. 2MFCol3.1]|jgi:branched-subunit amino acid transport protein|uniref:AzlD domain-containing protein n=1 Tax=Rhizobium sp. 2MFCol3.1 TaxID=1246459 RepID=UPI0003763887|nr:AzlD domain-containing protein [Rhizobium sp. 2MFCol3.1]
MTVWLMVMFAATSAFAFRALPIAFGKVEALQNPNSTLFRFLNFSSQAMLGATAYTMAFGKQDVVQLVGSLNIRDVLAFGLLAAGAAVVAGSGRVLSTVLIGTTIYWLAGLAT